MCPMYAAARTCLSPRLAIAVGACARVGLRKYVFHATCKPAPGRTTSTIETHCLSNEIDETWSSRLTVLRIPRGDPFGNPLEELTAAHVSWSTCVTKTISSDADRGYTALASGARVLRRVGTMWRLARGPGRGRRGARAHRWARAHRSALTVRAHGHSTLTGVRLDIIIRQSTGPQAALVS